jgi:hypothetical protein
MMVSDTLSHFRSLDELVQVVYQGFSRFVVLSKVDDESWAIHLGLSGQDGRWWRGAWTEEDILQLAVRSKICDVYPKSRSLIFESGLCVC